MKTALNPSHARSLIRHAVVALSMGLIGGAGLVVTLLGHLELAPIIGKIEMTLPGDTQLWRNAHTGPIMNALFVMLIAALGPFFQLTAKRQLVLHNAALLMLWGNSLGYNLAPFASNRGLAWSADLTSNITYVLFFVAALSAMVVLFQLFTAARQPSNAKSITSHE